MSADVERIADVVVEFVPVPGIAGKTARIETAPKDAPTSLRSLTHTDRLNRLEGSMKPIPALTDAETQRFWSKVRKTSTCWIWDGNRCIKDYGLFWIRNSHYRAHRVSYVLHRGAIPDDMVIDHLCRIHECVNPDHLRPLTATENTLIGISPSAIASRQTHCVNGHEFNAENTDESRGYRSCIPCRNTRARVRRQTPTTCPHCGSTHSVAYLPGHIRRVHGDVA